MAALLAKCGYNSLRLSDDWQGADFIACHIDGENFLKVQLKGRFGLNEKYVGKDIHIAFFDGPDCYIFPHDKVRQQAIDRNLDVGAASAENVGNYTWSKPPKWAKQLLGEYRLDL